MTNKDECKELGVKNKFVVYPWEIIEEEIMEVNNSLDLVLKLPVQTICFKRAGAFDAVIAYNVLLHKGDL